MSAVSMPIPITLASSRTIACGPISGAPAEPLGTCLLDRADLLTDQCQPSHVAPELLDDVCRQARALRCPQTCQALRRLAQMRLESPNAATGELPLHAVGDARALVDKALALAARAPRILLLHRRDRHHPAVPPLTAQPSQEYAHQHRRIQSVRLRPLALA